MNTFLDYVWNNKIAFFGTFFLVFLFSYLILVAVDFLPEEPSEQTEATNQVETETKLKETVTGSVDAVKPAPEAMNRSQAALPLTIKIDKLDKTIAVLNPTSRNIADLDKALLEGVVRHPDSATLTETGNVFILGHSSYLPTVFNKNFQAFNGIQNLKWGDTIEVTTADTIYQYRVEKVYRARAQDVTVPMVGTGNMLTLATCNSFGSVDDRYIVEAKQVSKQLI